MRTEDDLANKPHYKHSIRSNIWNKSKGSPILSTSAGAGDDPFPVFRHQAVSPQRSLCNHEPGGRAYYVFICVLSFLSVYISVWLSHISVCFWQMNVFITFCQAGDYVPNHKAPHFGCYEIILLGNRGKCANSLPRVVTLKWNSQQPNMRPLSCESDSKDYIMAEKWQVINKTVTESKIIKHYKARFFTSRRFCVSLGQLTTLQLRTVRHKLTPSLSCIHKHARWLIVIGDLSTFANTRHNHICSNGVHRNSHTTTVIQLTLLTITCLKHSTNGFLIIGNV